MAAATAPKTCSHCSAENSFSRDICFRCREPLNVINGTAAPLPSVFNISVPAPAWTTRIWHEVCVPGSLLEADGRTRHEMIIREIGTESLVFDSDFAYQPSETLRLEFTLEETLFVLDCAVRRTARTLNMEMCFATTVDLGMPGSDFVRIVTELNPVSDNEWWD